MKPKLSSSTRQARVQIQINLKLMIIHEKSCFTVASYSLVKIAEKELCSLPISLWSFLTSVAQLF